MSTSKREGIRTLLKGIETGDPESVRVVNEAKYIQHNPMTAEGSPGLAQLFANLARTDPHVELHRMFEDGDYVFGHVEYDFAETAVGFEVFRFEGGYAVEHWDNLQRLHPGKNPSGRTMTDGPTKPVDLDRTEINREIIRDYTSTVLFDRRVEDIETYVSPSYAEHSPVAGDGVDALASYLGELDAQGGPNLRYETLHRVLAEGNFVLCASEGTRSGTHVAIYDMFRLDNGLIVEHWDSIEPIAPRETWRNNNGKF